MFGLFRGEAKANENVRQGSGETEYNPVLTLGEGVPAGIPIGEFQGYAQPNIIIQALPGGQTAQVDGSPVTFARYNMARGMHDVQLMNGLQNKVAQGLIIGYPGEGYLNEIMPQQPGQSRLMGQNSGPQNFTPRGGAPSVWQNLVSSKAAADNQVNGGGAPGTLAGPLIYGGSNGG